MSMNVCLMSTTEDFSAASTGRRSFDLPLRNDSGAFKHGLVHISVLPTRRVLHSHGKPVSIQKLP